MGEDHQFGQLEKVEETPEYYRPDTKYQWVKQLFHFFRTLFLGLAVVILLSLIGIGSYLIAIQLHKTLKTNPQNDSKTVSLPVEASITPVQDPTAWQTYYGPTKFTTKESPYSFKYPPNWQVATPLRYVSNDYFEDQIGNNTSDLSQRYILTVDTIRNSASTLEEFISQHQTPESKPDLALNNYLKDNTVSIPNTDWMIDRNVSGAGVNESIIFMKGSTVVVLTCSNCGDDITNQIITTFRFSQ